MVLLLQYIPAPVFAEETPETGLCEHHAVHENCGYVAAIAGVDCNHEHDDSCFTTKCAHVYGDCGYVAAVESKACEYVCETCAEEEAAADTMSF